MRRWYAAGDARLWCVTGVVAVGAAGVLGLLARRGSWYADDLDFLIVGARGFGVEDLLTPVNDHLAPGLRATYALFAWAAPLNYDFTVVLRVLLWAAAAMLMAALLQRLHGRGGLTVVGTVFYALSPLSMPSFMSLSSAVNNLPAHVLGLVFLHCTLDWRERGRNLSLVAAACSLLASMLFWEKSALIVLSGAALLLSRHTTSEVRKVHGWWRWAAACAVAGAAFAILYVARGGPSSSDPPSFARATTLWAESLWHTLAPVVAGGPLTWAATFPPSFGLASPPWWASAAGTIVTAGLVGVCALRDRRALWWWAAVVAYSVATVAVVGYGRFASFGSVFTRHLHYWSDASVPLTLAVVASLALVRPARFPAVRRAMCAGLALVWLLAVGASNLHFGQLWATNPAKDYTRNLASSLRDRGEVNLWDTLVPDRILPLSDNRSVPAVARLISRDVEVQDPSSDPLLVRDDGTITASRLQAWGRSANGADCRYLLKGTGSVTVPLDQPVPSGYWYFRIGYLANPDTTVDVTAVGASGKVALVSGSPTWPAGLGTAFLRTARTGDVRYVVVSTREPRTNLCIGDITVGVPEPAP